MRKAQKKRVEDFIKLFTQAHDEIREFIESKNYIAAMDLLVQCQESAVQLGGLIEKAEEEGCKTVLLLENYCELVYQIHEEIVENRRVNGNKIHKKLRQSLVKIENSIKNDIKVKLEIVFMPYKASMWDSLESVWKAAVEDIDCDVYVVPIPYYDRKADFSFGEFHYEGEDFPDYVEVLHYDAYDLEQRRPDIVYIHNPYDEHNYVTSVDPRYYSSRIKKYTECLVYIPYCVYCELTYTDSMKMIEFCSRYITSGMLSADKVILQSENFRRIIVDTLLTYCGKNKEFWESKILGLGSPKYDKVRNVNKEELQVPDSWEKVIKKPDGSRKRIIFYNTSLNALLANGDQMNRKIRSVIQFFYDNREKYALLWRPHPLIRATIESMQPKLWEEYKEIVDDYRNKGLGIYDDTPDFHRAFAVSDAYYGDYSSLILLYQATGKPLLEQNTGILDYEKRFVTNKFYYDGEYVWGTAWEFNGLFKIHPKTYKVEYIGQFPNEKSEGYGLFYGIAEYGEKLYFCPYNAKNIAVYDKAASKFDTIYLKESIRDVDRKFGSILVDGKYIYLQGSRAYTIARLDAETNEIIYLENWVEEVTELENLHSQNFDFLIQKEGCVHEGNLYYFCLKACGLLRIKLDDFSYKLIPLQYSSTNGVTGIIDADELLWLFPNAEGFISYFDPQSMVLNKIVKIDGASSLCKVGEYIYYFSITEQHFYRIHTESKEITAFPIDEGICCSCLVEDKIFMTTYLTGELYVFDTVSLKITKVDLLIDNSWLPKFNELEVLEGNRKYNQYARESGYMNLRNLSEMDMADSNQQSSLENGGCGREIHKYVKGLVE